MKELTPRQLQVEDAVIEKTDSDRIKWNNFIPGSAYILQDNYRAKFQGYDLSIWSTDGAFYVIGTDITFHSVRIMEAIRQQEARENERKLKQLTIRGNDFIKEVIAPEQHGCGEHCNC